MDLEERSCTDFTNMAFKVGTDFDFCSVSGRECSDNICARSYRKTTFVSVPTLRIIPALQKSYLLYNRVQQLTFMSADCSLENSVYL